jgi:hypothetical protein
MDDCLSAMQLKISPDQRLRSVRTLRAPGELPRMPKSSKMPTMVNADTEISAIECGTPQRSYGSPRGDLVRDFENFNLLHLEILRTREKRRPVQSGVVRVNDAKVLSATVSACVAVIGNTNVTKVWTPIGITNDSQSFL